MSLRRILLLLVLVAALGTYLIVYEIPQAEREGKKEKLLGVTQDAITGITLTYPDRRKSKMINWFSKDVPFAASRTLGGLVKRDFGRLSMELIKIDRDARPELLIPPK